MAAMLWWDDLHPYDKVTYTARFYGEWRVFTSLTGREIQKIFDEKDNKTQPEPEPPRLTEYKKQTIDLTTLKQQVYGQDDISE